MPNDCRNTTQKWKNAGAEFDHELNKITNGSFSIPISDSNTLSTPHREHRREDVPSLCCSKKNPISIAFNLQAMLIFHTKSWFYLKSETKIKHQHFTCLQK